MQVTADSKTSTRAAHWCIANHNMGSRRVSITAKPPSRARIIAMLAIGLTFLATVGCQDQTAIRENIKEHADADAEAMPYVDRMAVAVRETEPTAATGSGVMP